jgi:hypothetical protein
VRSGDVQKAIFVECLKPDIITRKIRPGSVTGLPRKNRFSGQVDREADSNPIRIGIRSATIHSRGRDSCSGFVFARGMVI